MLTIITSLYKSEYHIAKFAKRLNRVTDFFDKKRFKYEVLIIANDPGEKELNVLENLMAKNNSIKYFKVPRESLYATWNRGIKLSRGNVITFWNVDDLRFPRAMMEGYEKLTDGYDIVYSPFVVVQKHKYYKLLPLPEIAFKWPDDYNLEINKDEMIWGPFFMFNKNIIDRVGLFDEGFKVVADYDWFIKAGLKGAKFFRTFLISGLYIKLMPTLSGGMGNNIIHTVENQVIFIRYGLEHKIKKLSPEEMKVFETYKV